MWMCWCQVDFVSPRTTHQIRKVQQTDADRYKCSSDPEEYGHYVPSSQNRLPCRQPLLFERRVCKMFVSKTMFSSSKSRRFEFVEIFFYVFRRTYRPVFSTSIPVDPTWRGDGAILRVAMLQCSNGVNRT